MADEAKAFKGLRSVSRPGAARGCQRAAMVRVKGRHGGLSESLTASAPRVDTEGWEPGTEHDKEVEFLSLVALFNIWGSMIGSR